MVFGRNIDVTFLWHSELTIPEADPGAEATVHEN